MTTVTHPLKKGYRTIRLPLAESEYDRFLSDRIYAKTRLDELYEEFPEVFPEAFPWGYALYGFTEPSIKQEIRCRRTRLDPAQAVFTIAPAFVMPYMTGRTQEVDHNSRRVTTGRPVGDQAPDTASEESGFSGTSANNRRTEKVNPGNVSAPCNSWSALRTLH